MRTILAVEQLTIYHAVSIWYDQVQKMHQSKPGFDLDLSVNLLQIENYVSWMVISCGLDRYVTPLSEGNQNSTRKSTISSTFPENSGTVQPVATHELGVTSFEAGDSL